MVKNRSSTVVKVDMTNLITKSITKKIGDNRVSEADQLSDTAKVNVLSKLYLRQRANSPVDRNGP